MAGGKQKREEAIIKKEIEQVLDYDCDSDVDMDRHYDGNAADADDDEWRLGPC